MQFARIMISNILPVTSTVLNVLVTGTELRMYCYLQKLLYKCIVSYSYLFTNASCWHLKLRISFLG